MIWEAGLLGPVSPEKMAEMVVTVDFSSADAPRQAELLAQAHRIVTRERIPVDLDLDGELLHLTVSGGPDDLRMILESLESCGCQGDVLLEFFSVEERKEFGQMSLSKIRAEILTWNVEKSAIPKVETIPCSPACPDRV